VVLLALVLAHHCSDLGRLTLQGRKYSAEGAVLRCTGLAKQARPGKEESLRPAVISHFLEDALLCPVLCLKAYERATASFRKKDSMHLFLAINSSHQPVKDFSLNIHARAQALCKMHLHQDCICKLRSSRPLASCCLKISCSFRDSKP